MKVINTEKAPEALEYIRMQQKLMDLCSHQDKFL